MRSLSHLIGLFGLPLLVLACGDDGGTAGTEGTSGGVATTG